MDFAKVCELVESELNSSWEAFDIDDFSAIELQKKAIIGYKNEVEVLKTQIKDALNRLDIKVDIPEWYSNVEEAIFHEVWGITGIAEWFSDEYKNSSSAKIIGDRIYFLVDGVMKLMPQKIDADRRDQLVRALLLRTPEERSDKAFHELYMLDGTRVTIFRDGIAKNGLDVIIFRRYIVPIYSFEEQSSRKTIPREAIPFFENMVSLGYNVVFCGSVRSAKTTFLSTWQSYEDPTLEGVMVETDPEIPIHELMPEAPVVQLIADGENLGSISKNLMRSDADYFILAEARDGIALDTAIRIAGKGTRRMKMTFHLKDPRRFATDAAVEIVRSLGGDLNETSLRVASSFDYVFHFVNLRNKNLKKLNAIYEMSAENGQISLIQICKYDVQNDEWEWNMHIGDDKESQGKEENAKLFEEFYSELEKLSLQKYCSSEEVCEETECV